MQKAKNVTIIVLIFLILYFLFSQFYLKTFGNIYTYIINPIFFILFATIMKLTMESVYKTTAHKKNVTFYVFITAGAYGIILLVSGLFLSFGHNPYSNTVNSSIIPFT